MGALRHQGTSMTHTARISLFKHAQPQLQAMMALSAANRNGKLDARLVELVQLRVSLLLVPADILGGKGDGGCAGIATVGEKPD